jgi:hypothetical protein
MFGKKTSVKDITLVLRGGIGPDVEHGDSKIAAQIHYGQFPITISYPSLITREHQEAVAKSFLSYVTDPSNWEMRGEVVEYTVDGADLMKETD